MPQPEEDVSRQGAQGVPGSDAGTNAANQGAEGAAGAEGSPGSGETEDFLTGSGIDPATLDPVLQPIYKGMQGHFTRRTQDLSAKSKDIETVRTENARWRSLMGDEEIMARIRKMAGVNSDGTPITGQGGSAQGGQAAQPQYVTKEELAARDNVRDAERDLADFAAAVDQNEWSTKGDLFKRVVPSYRNAKRQDGTPLTIAEKCTEAWKMVGGTPIGTQSSGGNNQSPRGTRGSGERATGGNPPPGPNRRRVNETPEERMERAAEKADADVGKYGGKED